jgi:parvulin-like peptidyl-prolyl isomerase
MPRTFFRLLSSLAAFSICLLAAALPSAKGAAPSDDSSVIARVGNDEVTADEIRAAIANLDPTTQAAAAHDPQALSQVVRAILTQRLVLKQALAAKWDQDPSVTAELARLRETAIAQTYLQSVSKPPDSYPSDAEIQEAYDSNKSHLLVARQFRLAQIYVRDLKGPDAAKVQVKLEGIRKALAKRDADFAAIARAESDETQTAAKGGEIGWLAETKIQPEIRAQLGSMAKGSVSQPVHLEDGWHILKVLEVKEPYTPPLEEIRSQLIQEMRAEKAKADSQQYIAKLLQDNPVQINELNLSKVLKQP